ncbi:MAG: UDP-N-acetylmuramoyl-L-alanyl-D-glutamate--2,6-diaminopimelate ligase [Clostridium sp.]|nr:UDP-N-acetylmuramoyl-L-alanyl-D-glutamate--2,6-diaminopimelate ligase [Clostridium sp.]
MQLQQLFDWYDGRLPAFDGEITGLTDRLERLRPGNLFVCIKGRHFDGHVNAQAALENGAAFVVTRQDLGLERQIIVQDSRAAMSLLCAAWHGYPARRLKLIGITGTNGKTSTAFLLRDILEAAGEKTGLIGTVQGSSDNAEPSFTTPEPFLFQYLLKSMADKGCTHCVAEISSQALEQRRTAGLPFAAAVFTNLTQDHLDYHGSMEEYRAVKRCLLSDAALCVINLDDPSAEYMAQASLRRTVSYSLRLDEADYTAKNLAQGLDGVRFDAVALGKITRLRLQTPGRFSAQNALASLAAAVELGVDFSAAAQALSHSKGIPGRLERVPTDTPYRVYIDYAHTPDALENVLTTLRECNPSRLLLLFGCGGDRDKSKRPQMGRIAAELADEVFLTNDNPRTEEPGAIIGEVLAGVRQRRRGKVHVEPDRALAIAQALKSAREGDIILLAGKGHEDYQLLSAGKIHFDEREIVRRALLPAANDQ